VIAPLRILNVLRENLYSRTLTGFGAITILLLLPLNMTVEKNGRTTTEVGQDTTRSGLKNLALAGSTFNPISTNFTPR
jgi:hypothetical protein